MAGFRNAIQRALFRKYDVCGVIVRSIDDEDDQLFQSVSAALHEIKLHDPNRFRRLRSDLEGGGWTDATVIGCAHFDATSFSCKIDAGYARSASIRDLALTIVHEATHARLWRQARFRRTRRRRKGWPAPPKRRTVACAEPGVHPGVRKCNSVHSWPTRRNLAFVRSPSRTARTIGSRARGGRLAFLWPFIRSCGKQ